MFKKVDDAYPLVLRYAPDWFVTPKLLEVLDNNEFDQFFTLYSKYNQYKAYKKELAKGLMLIAWHP